MIECIPANEAAPWISPAGFMAKYEKEEKLRLRVWPEKFKQGYKGQLQHLLDPKRGDDQPQVLQQVLLQARPFTRLPPNTNFQQIKKPLLFHARGRPLLLLLGTYGIQRLIPLLQQNRPEDIWRHHIHPHRSGWFTQWRWNNRRMLGHTETDPTKMQRVGYKFGLT